MSLTPWEVAELLGFVLILGLLARREWVLRVERLGHNDLNAGMLYGLKQIRAALAVADRELTRYQLGEPHGWRLPEAHPLSDVYRGNRAADQWAEMLQRGEVILTARGVVVRGELIPTLKPDPKEGWPAPLHECERCGFREWSEADWLKGSPMRPAQKRFEPSTLLFEDRKAPAIICPNCNNIQECEPAG